MSTGLIHNQGCSKTITMDFLTSNTHNQYLSPLYFGGGLLWVGLSAAFLYIQYFLFSQQSPLEASGEEQQDVSMTGSGIHSTSSVKRTCPQQKVKQPPQLPGRLPLVGHIFANLFDPTTPHLGLTQLSKKHGKIFSMQILQQDIVVINDLDLIKEALSNNQLAGRPYIFRIHYGFHYAKDIIFGNYSKKWAYMKKIAGQGLRSFGPGSVLVDDIIDTEKTALVSTLTHLSKEGAFDPRLCLLTSVVNGLTSSILGRRFDHDDPVMADYQVTTRLFSESCSIVNGMELDLFPWLRFLPNQNFKKLTHARQMLDNWVDSELLKTKERYVAGSPKCILDLLLENRNKATEDGLTITDQDVRSIFVDLLVSGTFTTAITLNTFTYILMEFPQLQKDLQECVDQHLGCRLPQGSDRHALPLVEATIMEILRFISHVPLNLPHMCLQDTTVGGYLLKKNSQVLMNLWNAHHDEKVWDEPWKFKPHRFLDHSGNLVAPDHKNRRSLMAFSSGRRACLGESLARERLFLFATMIVRDFHIVPPEGQEISPCDPQKFDLGLILEPKPFKIQAIPRDKKDN